MTVLDRVFINIATLLVTHVEEQIGGNEIFFSSDLLLLVCKMIVPSENLFRLDRH